MRGRVYHSLRYSSFLARAGTFISKTLPLTLPRMIIVSGLLHVFLIVGTILSAFPGRATTLYRPQYQVRLVGPEDIPSSKSPRSEGTTKPAKRPDPAKEEKKVVLPDEQKPQKPTQKVEDTDKPKKEAPPQKPSKTASKDPKGDAKIAEALKRVRDDLKDSNLLASKGSSPYGGLTGAAGSLEYSAYYDQIYERIRQNWSPPENYDPSAEDIVTVVSLSILPDGKIEKSWVEKSSGDRYFDESVMRAILKSDPLPPPPNGIMTNLLELGLRFHSRPDYETSSTP